MPRPSTAADIDASRRPPHRSRSRRCRAGCRRSRSTAGGHTTSPARATTSSSRPATSPSRASTSSRSVASGRGHRPRCRRGLLERHVHPRARAGPRNGARRRRAPHRAAPHAHRPVRCPRRGIPRRSRASDASARLRRRAEAVLGRLDVTAEEARDLRHGKRSRERRRLPAASRRRRSTPTAPSSASSSSAATISRAR